MGDFPPSFSAAHFAFDRELHQILARARAVAHAGQMLLAVKKPRSRRSARARVCSSAVTDRAIGLAGQNFTRFGWPRPRQREDRQQNDGDESRAGDAFEEKRVALPGFKFFLKFSGKLHIFGPWRNRIYRRRRGNRGGRLVEVFQQGLVSGTLICLSFSVPLRSSCRDRWRNDPDARPSRARDRIPALARAMRSAAVPKYGSIRQDLARTQYCRM